MKRRIGIFAGSFDPVHEGHLAFSLEAVRQADLECVDFLPERRPPGKADVTDLAHRVAMLQLAITGYPQLGVLDDSDGRLSVPETLPRLEQRFAGSQLFFLMGLDVLASLPTWPSAEQLLARCGLIVAPRRESRERAVELIHALAAPPRALYVIETAHGEVSSTAIRSATAVGRQGPGSLASVEAYVNKHRLYRAADRT